MKFDIYCDESRPDLFSSKNPRSKYVVIGSLWLESENRDLFKKEIHQLRDKHKIGPEFKWQKVSPSKIDFYKELIDWFNSKKDSLRFRCIAVSHEKVDLMRYHEKDQELGFYKFYYQMLHHWIMDFNEYSIFCDFITNRSRDRLPILQRCLDHSNLSSQVLNVQATRSRDSVLIQLTDVLTGMAASRLNKALNTNSAKTLLVEHYEKNNRPIRHTLKSEQKFNVFVINLDGGW